MTNPNDARPTTPVARQANPFTESSAVAHVQPQGGVAHEVVIPHSKLDAWKQNRNQAAEYLRQHPMALTLDFLLANDLPVYVRNNTGNGSVLLFNMIDNSGRRIGAEIKPAPIPVNMTQRFSADVLTNSPEFVDLLYKQLLVLVNPETAEQELESPLAQAFLSKNASRVAKSNVAPRTVDPTAGSKQATVSEKMRSIVHEVQKEQLVGMDAVMKLFGSFPIFTPADFNYLYGQLADDQFLDITTAVRAEAKRRNMQA